MKIHHLSTCALLTALLLCPMPIFAGDNSHAGHDHGTEKAPHNGRLMEIEKMHVEFVLQPDRTVRVYFYDESMKPLQTVDPQVTLILQGKDAASKTKVEWMKKEEALVSSTPLVIPEGAKAALVIKIGDKTQNLRFNLDLSMCGECKAPEYACKCAH